MIYINDILTNRNRLLYNVIMFCIFVLESRGSDKNILKKPHMKEPRPLDCGVFIMPKGEHLKTHGLSYHPLHKIWMGIKSRCYNPNVNTYKYYGARGIKMCDEWLDNPQAFFDYIMSLPNAMGRRLTLDRENNDRDYEYNNLRWATKSEQGANQRMMSNNTSGYTGINKHGNNWTARINVNKETIRLGTYKYIEDAVKVRNNYIIDNNLTSYKIQKYVAKS